MRIETVRATKRDKLFRSSSDWQTQEETIKPIDGVAEDTSTRGKNTARDRGSKADPHTTQYTRQREGLASDAGAIRENGNAFFPPLFLILFAGSAWGGWEHFED